MENGKCCVWLVAKACTLVNLEDIEKRCKMNVWLQKSALVQPKTDLQNWVANQPLTAVGQLDPYSSVRTRSTRADETVICQSFFTCAISQMIYVLGFAPKFGKSFS